MILISSPVNRRGFSLSGCAIAWPFLFPPLNNTQRQPRWGGEAMRMDKYSSGTAIGWGSFTAMLGALSLNDWA
ncbi:HP1 family phage holin, partial [Pectobacterium parmentieri]|uniref:HP1 family phage holin n=1 Tax=Pectobacterium parmentieri TaxID=1905730 RepID=UPI002FCCE526